MHTACDTQLPAAGRKRAHYPAAFKAQLLAACAEPGAGTAAIAKAHGLNANLLRRWIAQHRRQTQDGALATPGTATPAGATGFVQLTAAGHCAPLVSPTGNERLHLSISRGELQASLSLPADQHSQCASILKLLLS